MQDSYGGNHMKKKTLDRVIDSLLFEADTTGMPNIVYGIHDRPISSAGKGSEFETTVPGVVPLRPTELMSSQLAVERPPIEDEDYAPATVSDLRKAMSAIAGLVPPDSVEKFYRQALVLLDKIEEEEMSKSAAKPVELGTPDETVKTESKVRARRPRAFQGLDALIESLEILVLSENEGDVDLYSPRAGERLRSRFDPKYRAGKMHDIEASDYDTAVETEDEPGAKAAAAPDDDQVLAQLAQQFGYSGPSGIRQALQRLYALMKYLITQVGVSRVEDMMGTVVPEFIEHAVDLELFDEEDSVELMASPVYVRQMDSFRNYFNSLYRPVYQQLLSDKEKELRQDIQALGIPPEVVDTVYNQVTGATARKDSVIAKKIAGEMSPDSVKSVLEKVAANFDVLKKKMSKMPDNLLDLTHARVDALGSKKKKQMVLDAFEETSSLRGPVGESRRPTRK